MSLSPVSLVSPKVSFRGENGDKADIIGAPGRYSAAPEEGDKVEISSEAAANEEPKKSSLWKNIGKGAVAVVVLLGASFGMFKWKGDKWLMPEAKGWMAGIKKAIVKPGEWIDKKIQRIANRGQQAADEAVDAGEEAAEGAAAKPEAASTVETANVPEK